MQGIKNKKYYFETQYENLSQSSFNDKRKDKGLVPHKKGKSFDIKLIQGKTKEQKLTKQDLVGNPTYTGFNKRYKENQYSVQPREKEFIEYRDLPVISELSKALNEERKRLKFTIEDVELNLDSQSPHHWFNAESYPSAEDWNKLKEIGFRITQFDNQMTDVFKKSSEKRYAIMGTSISSCGRNKRAVWKITTKPFKESHFAVYPEELCETPIRAGCPEGGIVLDPFFGAGTTGLVALKQNKQFIGIELNEKYIEIAKRRLLPYLEQKKL